jgi:succinylglutamate desuccinylase
MAELTDTTIDTPVLTTRILGRIRGPRPGPTVLVVGGIHGNEPAGIAAARRVLTGLRAASDKVHGEFAAVAGNLSALARKMRFIHKDLNRAWAPEAVDTVLRDGHDSRGVAEDAELLALLQVIDRVLADARGATYFLDLHTSSAAGCPFVTVGDTLQNRAFASAFPLPLILGLEEQVDGALLEYLNNRGLITMGVEGGQHEAPESADHLEAVLWLSLVATGVLDHRDVPAPGCDAHRDRLSRAAAGAPRVIGVRHRHPVLPGDGFRMKPGFTNFQPVRRGTVLAQDSSGVIEAPEDGMILLPLYQGLGEDGFFIAREVAPWWLGVSALLRRMRLGRLARFLPGVRAHPDASSTLIVDTRVARLFPLEVMHLLGYRKSRPHGRFLWVSRRRFDLAPPPRAEGNI